jgi:hypothetical protein
MSLSRTRILTIYSHKVDKVVLFMLILDLYIILLRVIERDFDSGHILPERIFDFNVSTYVWHALISFLTVYGVSKFFFNRESWCFCLLSFELLNMLSVGAEPLPAVSSAQKKKERKTSICERAWLACGFLCLVKVDHGFWYALDIFGWDSGPINLN